MEMRYFFTCDQVERGIFDVVWHPGLENLADYFTKHFAPVHHRHVRPFYLQTPNSPTELPRALAPKELRNAKTRAPLHAIARKDETNGEMASYSTDHKAGN